MKSINHKGSQRNNKRHTKEERFVMRMEIASSNTPRNDGPSYLIPLCSLVVKKSI
jgi:hypothetical protein